MSTLEYPNWYQYISFFAFFEIYNIIGGSGDQLDLILNEMLQKILPYHYKTKTIVQFFINLTFKAAPKPLDAHLFFN